MSRTSNESEFGACDIGLNDDNGPLAWQGRRQGFRPSMP